VNKATVKSSRNCSRVYTEEMKDENDDCHRNDNNTLLKCSSIIKQNANILKARKIIVIMY